MGVPRTIFVVSLLPYLSCLCLVSDMWKPSRSRELGAIVEMVEVSPEGFRDMKSTCDGFSLSFCYDRWFV